MKYKTWIPTSEASRIKYPCIHYWKEDQTYYYNVQRDRLYLIRVVLLFRLPDYIHVVTNIAYYVHQIWLD